MLARLEQMVGSKVISLHAAGAIAEVAEPIIDPDKLTLAGFYVGHPKIRDQAQILLAQDIRQISPGRVFINSVDELTAKTDLVRLKPILELNFQLVGKPVVTESGKKIGRVSDYIVDTTSWTIQKIYIKPSILKSFAATNLIVDRSQIVEVSNSKITVSDATIAKPAVAPQRAA